MVLITLVFLVFVSAVIRRERWNGSTLDLYGLIAAWTVAFTAFFFHMGQQGFYFLYLRDFFPLDWFLLTLFTYRIGVVDPLITLVNVGNFLFYYFFLTFCISFTQPTKKMRTLNRWLLLVPMLAGMLLFDPLFVRALSRLAARTGGRFDLPYLWNGAQTFFRVLQPLYVVIGVAALARHSIFRPRVRGIRFSIGLVDVSVIAFAVMFYAFFAGHPYLLSVPTLVPQYTRTAVVDISTRIPLLQLLPVVQVVVLSVLIFSSLRFWKLTSTDSRFERHIKRSLHVASLGSRVIGHSFKNYLFAIQSEVRFMMEQNTEDDNPELYRRLEKTSQICDEASAHLRRSTNMLRVHRLDMEPRRLGLCVREAVHAFESTRPAVAVGVTGAEPGPIVYLDDGHFREVLSNILGNATQACTEIGAEADIRVSHTSNSRWATLQIHDNGPGIDEEAMPHVFEPFYTGRNPRTNWGIGLTYCYHVISAHDGRIEVSNHHSGGAVVTIDLPLV
jgi:signal transduction histidine kinase